MNAWNQPFNAYRARTSAYPWWVTRLPLAFSCVLLVPVLLAALVAVLAGVVLFVVLLLLWKMLSAFMPSGGGAPAADAGRAPEADGGRVNVRVIEREG